MPPLFHFAEFAQKRSCTEIAPAAAYVKEFVSLRLSQHRVVVQVDTCSDPNMKTWAMCTNTTATMKFGPQPCMARKNQPGSGWFLRKLRLSRALAR
jgi:hypothetical protein